MKKEELIKKIANRADSTIETSRKFLGAIEDIVMEAIALEDEVHFSFGTIGGKTQKPRKYKNVVTGEMCYSPEKPGQPYYKPSKKAKDW